MRQYQRTSVPVVVERDFHECVAERRVLLGQGDFRWQSGDGVEVDPHRRPADLTQDQHLSMLSVGGRLVQGDVRARQRQLPGQPQRRGEVEVPQARGDPPGLDGHVNRARVEHEVDPGHVPYAAVADLGVPQFGGDQKRVRAEGQAVARAHRVLDQGVAERGDGLGLPRVGAPGGMPAPPFGRDRLRDGGIHRIPASEGRDELVDHGRNVSVVSRAVVIGHARSLPVR
jgi:hypothetical protein